MAVVINVAGVTLVQVAPAQATPFVAATYPAGTLVSLGYTRDGAEVTFNGYFLDVPTDENGGDAGPPTDVQFMGLSANIRLDSTKFDGAVMAFLRMRIAGSGVAGVPGAPVGSTNPNGWATGAVGQLMLGNLCSFRLLLSNVNNPFNFPTAFPRDAENLNVGTKYTSDMMEWFAIRGGVGGVLWNQVTS